MKIENCSNFNTYLHKLFELIILSQQTRIRKLVSIPIAKHNTLKTTIDKQLDTHINYDAIKSE